MGTGLKSVESEILGEYYGCFRRTKAGAVMLGVLQPLGSGLAIVGIAGEFIGKDQRVAVIGDWRVRRFNGFLQVRHNHVDARGERVSLFGLQIIRQRCWHHKNSRRT